jgi:hypothetical protein
VSGWGLTLATIVEGDGDVAAVPLLLRNIKPDWFYPRPIRVKRQKIIHEREIHKYAALARANIMERGLPGAVLMLLDADDDCPAELGPRLLGMLRAAISPYPCAVVLANRMFESWLLGGRCIKGYTPPSSIELTVKSPKRIIKNQLGQYRETVDQPRLVSRIDLVTARENCPSFDKLIRVIAALDQGS